MRVKLLLLVIVLVFFLVAIVSAPSASATTYGYRYPTHGVYSHQRFPARRVHYAKSREHHVFHLNKKKIAIEAAKIAAPSLVKLAIFGAA